MWIGRGSKKGYEGDGDNSDNNTNDNRNIDDIIRKIYRNKGRKIDNDDRSGSNDNINNIYVKRVYDGVR